MKKLDQEVQKLEGQGKPKSKKSKKQEVRNK